MDSLRRVANAIGTPLLPIVIGVDLDEMLPLFWDIIFTEDRFHRTGGLTRATVNTLVRIDVEHFSTLELRLVFPRMDAINRTDIHTSRVFGSNTGFADDIRRHIVIYSLAVSFRFRLRYPRPPRGRYIGQPLWELVGGEPRQLSHQRQPRARDRSPLDH